MARKRSGIADPTYGLRCEVRAVEEGHRAFVKPGGSIQVISDTLPGIRYEVRFEARVTGLIHFYCDCLSGTHRQEKAVPCKHAALAGRRLERENIAVWREGNWWVHPDLKATEDEKKRPVAPPNVSALVD